jgi:hypothetical protein
LNIFALPFRGHPGSLGRRNIITGLLINFVPLALAAIAPVGMGLVILMLTSQKGVSKTLAYLIAQALAFAVWGVVFLTLSANFEGLRPSEPSRAGLTLRIFLGILLLIIAVRVFFNDQDPDALPLKYRSLLGKISVVAMFFLNFFLSLLQLRFVLLIMAGTDMINNARLSPTGTFLGLLILLIVLLWPQFLPLVVYATMRDQRDEALKAMDDWLKENSRLVNTGLLGLIGLVLLWGGLSGLAAG